MRNLSVYAFTSTYQLARNASACFFPAPYLGFLCFLTSCLKLFQNAIHFWEQHKLKFKKYMRLFLLSAPCFIYINITKRLHRIHRQPILRFVQADLGPKWYQWTNEFIPLLTQNNPNRICSDKIEACLQTPSILFVQQTFVKQLPKKEKSPIQSSTLSPRMPFVCDTSYTPKVLF